MPFPQLYRSEYQINVSVIAPIEADPDVTALANGTFAITWSSDDAGDGDTRFAFLKANGDPYNLSFDDTTLAGLGAVDEFRPAVAALPDGRSVFVWDEEPATGERDVYAQIRSADGGNFNNRIDITAVTGVATDDQGEPTVLGLANGNFAVAYRDTAPATDLINVRFWNLFGNFVNQVAVSTTAVTNSTLNRPQMAQLQNGNVVVTWSSGPAGAGQQKFAIVSQSSLIPIKAETDVNPEDAVNEVVGSDVIALADGNFLIVFTRPSDVDDIQGRLFDVDGNPLGPRFSISVGTGLNPAATAAQDGRFMVVHESASSIFGRMFFASGAPDDVEAVLDAGVGIQGDPAIATLSDGRIVVTWRTSQNGTDDIYAEIYDPRETALYFRSATSFNDDWVGTPFADVVLMGGGNDTMFAGSNGDFVYGETGNDTLNGEAGADRLYGGDGTDTIDGGDAGDVLFGDAGNDTVNGAIGNDRIYGGDGNDTINGDVGLDTITAGNGNDIVNGGADIDTLSGEGGNDTIDGGTEDDTLGGNNGDDTLIGNLGNDRLDGDSGIDTINGDGGNDNITGDDGNDILNGGTEVDLISGGIDNDTIDGGDGDDGNGIGALFGNDGDDTIRGGSGNDFIDGGANSDRLIGQAGNDILNGGTGADDFVFEFPTEGNDQVLDWVALDDQIEIDASAFGGGLAAGALAANRLVVSAAPVANQAFGQFLYNTATGQLSWDADGTGVGVAVNIVRLLNGGLAVSTLAVGDFDIVA